MTVKDETLRLEYCSRCQHGFYVSIENRKNWQRFIEFFSRKEHKILCQSCPVCGKKDQVKLSRIVIRGKNGKETK